MADLPTQSDVTPFDQYRWLGEPPWKSGMAVEAWEKAHGHDVRLKCYPEYGCLAIENELIRHQEMVVELRHRIKSLAGEMDEWMLPIVRDKVLELLNDLETL